MSEWKTVIGQNEPETVDTTTSPNTVYLRRNIEEYTHEVDGETITEYQYDELKMTRQEYAVYVAEQNSEAIDEILISMLEG